MLNAYLAGKKLMGGEYSQWTVAGKSFLAKKGRISIVPKIGDKIYFYSSTLKRVAHVGVVIEVHNMGSNYTITTIEGNTSSGKAFDRNGGMVVKKFYTFNLSEVGGTNRINCFVTPIYGEDTCRVEDFIAVLKEEVGYIEKGSAKDLENKTANAGDKNFTKYGKFFADNKLGQNGVYWCEQFISWCAYKACERYRQEIHTGWEQVEGFWIYKENGRMVKGAWREIGGKWYVFDNAGRMITGWFKSKDEWYYLNPDDGAMLSSQWLRNKDKWYYLTESGAMAVSEYISDGENLRYVNADGVWEAEKDIMHRDPFR